VLAFVDRVRDQAGRERIAEVAHSMNEPGAAGDPGSSSIGQDSIA
jgi:hypothetical protein